MPVTWSLGSHWKFRHPVVLLAAVIGTPTVAAIIWMFSTHNWWKTSAGPFLEFEIRLPPGILLPADNNIEVTFWSGGTGRGCRGASQPSVRGDASSIPGRPWGRGKCLRSHTVSTTSAIWFVHNWLAISASLLLLGVLASLSARPGPGEAAPSLTWAPTQRG